MLLVRDGTGALTLALVLTYAVLAAEPEKPRLPDGDEPLPAGAVARLGTPPLRLVNECTHVKRLAACESSLAAPDNPRRFAIGRNLILYDLTTGKVIRRIPALKDGKQRTVIDAHLTPDGKTLFADAFEDGVSVYDPATGRLLEDLPIPGWRDDRRTLRLSADGKRLAIQERKDRLHAIVVWDLAGKKRLTSLGVAVEEKAYPQLALAADGKRVATWSGDRYGDTRSKTLQLWDVDAGKELRRIETEESVQRAALSPDGKLLAVAEWQANLSVWDVDSGKLVHRFATHRGRCRALTFSPDGKRLILGTEAGLVQIWETESGKRVGSYEAPECELRELTFQDDGTILAVGTYLLSWYVWEPVSGRVVGDDGGHRDEVRSIAFSRDSKSVYTASVADMCVWDARTGTRLRRWKIPDQVNQRSLGQPALLSPDGGFLFTRRAVFDTRTGRPLSELENVVMEMDKPAAVATQVPHIVVADRRHLDDDRWEAAVKVWSYADSREVARMTIPNMADCRALLSPDGKFFAVHAHVTDPDNRDKSFYEMSVWGIDGKPRWRRPLGGMQLFPHMAYSPDGSLLAVSDTGENVELLDAATGSLVRRLDAPHHYGTFAFSPDSRTLAVESYEKGKSPDAVIALMELATGRRRAEFPLPDDWPNVLAFSPDGRLLASGHRDTTAYLWDMTGRTDPAVGADQPPLAKELADLWAALGSEDAAVAYRAVQRLAAHPKAAAALVRKELPPVTEKLPDGDELARLFTDLDHDQFERREQASRKLLGFASGIGAQVKKALDDHPSAEKKRRLQQLLDKASSRVLLPEQVRPERALEALDRGGTPEARQLLEELARGRADAWLTREAKTVVERWKAP